MRHFVHLVFLVCFFSVNFSLAQSTSDTVEKLRSFDYDKATDLSSMEGFARDGARKFLDKHFKDSAKQWIEEAQTKWAKENNLPSSLGVKNLMGMQQQSRFGVPQLADKYTEFLKSELTNRMKLDMPGQVDEFIRNDLLHSTEALVDDAATDMNKMIEKISGNVLGDVQKMVTGTVDAWSGAVANQLNGMGGMRGTFYQGVMLTTDPASMVDAMANQLTDTMGKATKLGMEEFIDSKMFDQFGANFSGIIAENMKLAADAIEGLGSLAGGNLGAIEGQLKDALAGSPLGGLGVEEYMSYFDQMMAQKVHDLDMPEISLPNVEIPTVAYAGILLAASASHFGRCCGFLYFNPQEIVRGIRLIKLAMWQLDNKPDSFMLVGGDLMGRGLLGGHGKELSDESVKKLEDAISKMESVTDKTERAVALKNIQDVIADMDKVKQELDQAFLDMQKEIAAQADKVTQKVAEVTDKSSDPIKKSEECLNDPVACGYKKVDGVENKNVLSSGDSQASNEADQADKTSPLDPVVLYSGEFLLESTDLRLKGRGLELRFTRHYRNQWERLGPLGFNWTHEYDEKLITDPASGDQIHQQANGMRYRYRKTKDGSFMAPKGIFSQLSAVESGHQLIDPSRVSHWFNKPGRLIKLSDAHDNFLQFEYGLSHEQKVLVRVTDTLGQSLNLQYNQKGQIESIKDSLAREVTFTYDAEQNLTAVRSPLTEEFPKGKQTRYRYSGGNLEPSLNHNLIMIMDPKGQLYLRNSYGTADFEKDRLIAQTFGDKDSSEMTVKYESLHPEKLEVNTATSRTIIKDRNGHEHSYTHNMRGMLLSYEPPLPLERGKATYLYNSDDLLVNKSSPYGRTENYTYDEGNPNRAAQKNLLSYELNANQNDPQKTLFTYDSKTNQLSSRTRVGPTSKRTETFSYTDFGLLQKIIHGGMITTYEYNLNGQRVKETKGPWSRSYQYEGANLISQTDRAGGDTRTVQFGYDQYGNVNKVIDPSGYETRYWLNALNLVMQKQDALGHKTYFNYDANNNLSGIIRENKGGNNVEAIGYELREKFTYDTLDNLQKKEIQVNRDQWMQETYAYDPSENLIEHINFNGIKKQYSYDAQNRLLKESINGAISRTLNYDDAGRLINTANALGQGRSFQWDPFSRIKRFTDPTGTTVKSNYTEFGQLAAYQVFDVKDNLLQEMRFDYDELGRRWQSQQKIIGTDQWVTSKFAYADSHLAEISDDLGLTQKRNYNGFGELASLEDGAGNLIKYSYDNRGLIIREEKSRGNYSLIEAYSYDALGRLKTSKNLQGHTTEQFYDSLGNLIKTLDPLQREHLYTYDGLGRLQSEQFGARERQLKWNENGFVASFIDGTNKEYRFTYDGQGRKQTETDPAGRVRQYEYNQLGQLAQLKIGQETYSYSYDPAQRITERKSASGYVQTFNYDSLGRLIESRDSNDPENPADDVTIKYAYDSLGNLVKEMSQNLTLQKTYDARGRNTQIIYPSGEVIAQSFNPANNLTEVQANGQTLAQFDYAIAGLPKQENLGNGLVRDLSFNNLLQATGDTYQDQSKKISQTNYAYDELNRVIRRESAIEKKWQNFSYNNLDQLEHVDTKINNQTAKRSYAYDVEGQWQEILKQDNNGASKITITQGPGYQYQNFGTENLSYDERGNLIGYGEKLFEYDAWNRLVRVRDKADNKEIASYTYDASNRRVSKQNQSGKTNFTYNNWNLIEEYNNFPSPPSSTYYHSTTIDQPVALKTNNENYFYHRDRQGSITALSNKNKEIVERYEYDEYGNLKNSSSIKLPLPRGEGAGGRVNNPLTYTAQYKDEETDFYYYKNRYYSAKLGRFLTQDPLGMIDSPNPYAYVINDPLNWIDPLGMEKAYGWNADFTGRTGGKWDIMEATNFRSDNPYINELYTGVNNTVGMIAAPVNVLNNAAGAVLFDGPAALEDVIVEYGGPSFDELYISSLGAPMPFELDNIATGTLVGISRISRGAGQILPNGRIIVIGENMTRVKDAARANNAKWYKAWRIDPWDPDLAMKRNSQWIMDKKKEGFEIIDIGINPAQNNRSPFYIMEKEVLRDYPVKEIYWPPFQP